MKFGLSKTDYDRVDRLLFQPLKKKACRIWVFGSRARGDHRKFSDLDVLYTKLDSNEFPNGFLSEIKEQLEESPLPIKINIVSSEDLAESYKPFIHKEKIEV